VQQLAEAKGYATDIPALQDKIKILEAQVALSQLQ